MVVGFVVIGKIVYVFVGHMEHRLSLLPNLAGYFEFSKGEWQGLEPSDFCKVIEMAGKYGHKTPEECRAYFDQLLAVTKQYGQPDTCQGIEKRITQGDGYRTPEELDEMVDRLSTGKPWNTDGLRCGNPEEKYEEVYNLGNLWWGIKGAMGDVLTLKRHGRLIQ